MKLAILFHFTRHTQCVSVNTHKIPLHLQNKIVEALHSKERLSISLTSFDLINEQKLTKGLKKIEGVIGINVVL